MKKFDRFGGALWLTLGIFICIMSLRLGIGDLHMPGAGFAPLIAGTLLAVSGLIMILSTFSRQFVDEKISSLLVTKGKRDPIFALSALFGYMLLLEYLGFLITSFIFLMALFKIKDTKRWAGPLGITISTVVVSYLVFYMWLKLPLPEGLLWF